MCIRDRAPGGVRPAQLRDHRACLVRQRDTADGGRRHERRGRVRRRLTWAAAADHLSHPRGGRPPLSPPRRPTTARDADHVTVGASEVRGTPHPPHPSHASRRPREPPEGPGRTTACPTGREYLARSGVDTPRGILYWCPDKPRPVSYTHLRAHET